MATVPESTMTEDEIGVGGYVALNAIQHLERELTVQLLGSTLPQPPAPVPAPAPEPPKPRQPNPRLVRKSGSRLAVAE